MIFKSLKMLFDIYRLVNFWIIRFYCMQKLHISYTQHTHTHTNNMLKNISKINFQNILTSEFGNRRMDDAVIHGLPGKVSLS